MDASCVSFSIGTAAKPLPRGLANQPAPIALERCDDVNSAPAPFTRRISCPQALGYESGRSARSQLILALDTTERSLTRRFGRGIQAEAARPDVLQWWVSHPSLPD